MTCSPDTEVHTLNTGSGLLRKLAQLQPVPTRANETRQPPGARTGADG